MMQPATLIWLREKLGEEVQENVSLAPYTSARIGGPADVLITANSADELAGIINLLREQQLDYFMLGGGSNILVSDKGVRGITVLNRAKAVRFGEEESPAVWAESGAVLSNLSRRAAAKGLAGLEWACTVPGTVGGAVYGNAGAFGGDMSGSLNWAEVLVEGRRERWPVGKLEYGYRSSILKRATAAAVILAAEMKLEHSTKEAVMGKIEQFSERRKASQPPGASMGSMFKNPQGDFAGRLIEAAGLKGTRIGTAEISPLHGNFFLNQGDTQARDIRALIELAQGRVKEKFGIDLELEIELVGEW